ncbi:4Fe-4S dicluster domain-containing protein [Desulfonatronum sp. SC1]|uniref:4Fe-4S dicluster domain-containing protein n=1 Tax=Desulfonatronum sp. SC1 TaxID=2109626 RepID=UPI0018EE60F0|nr:4Fe-4S dicluster domain-containing protein [Desulfonatronum sp. SC1]
MARILPSEDLLVRMQRDVQRAMAGDHSKIKWSMVIDLAKCVGCHACTLACVAENKLPPGVVYRPVLEEEIGTYPNVRRRFVPRPCLQCQNPPCVKVCPVSATYKDAQGITIMKYNRCIGCRYCLVACPYAARTSDFGEWYTNNTPDQPGNLLGKTACAEAYERHPAPEYGEELPQRKWRSPIGNARKCHFCKHRLDKGMLPACVTTCIGRSTFFGNRNDPDSLIAELLASPRVFVLKPELSTKPALYYLK